VTSKTETNDPNTDIPNSDIQNTAIANAATRPPIVAIVGRPNVGKSTLMNRILGKRVAIVEEKPGVTRDRKSVAAEWLGVPFVLVDTGGWMPQGSALDRKVSEQAETAVREADVVMFVVDATVGLTEQDAAIAEWLRRSDRSVVTVVNKADSDRKESDIWEFLNLGLGTPFPISALHGRRTGDLLDEVIGRFPPAVAENAGAVPTRPTRRHPRDLDGDPDVPMLPGVALIGRPNVGKSTLFNRLIGAERSVVHDMPGTTRDAIDTIVDTPDGPIRFIDTAGMRRKARIDEATEYYSVARALEAVDTADVALLVIDAADGITAQDARLAERIEASGCPVVVMLNKWETLDAEQRLDVQSQLAQKLYFVGDAPVLKISALTGKGVHKLRPVLADAIERYQRRVPTRDVNKVLVRAQQLQPAPGGARVLYGMQGASQPPTFTLFVNRELPATYMRYLERKIREAFDLGAVPIKLRVRKRSG
jgi:GTPase